MIRRTDGAGPGARRRIGRAGGAGAVLAAVVALGSLAACAGAVDTAPLPQTRPGADAEADAAATGEAAMTAPVPQASPARFEDWRAGFRTRALAEGIRADVFDAAFAGVRVNPTVIERDRFQPEFVRPIWEYLDSAVSDARIATGREKAAANAALLDRIEAAHGVDRGVVVAIWGLESAYGAVKGDISVIEGLATLAYDGRRRAFAEEQLLAALRILQSGDIAAPRLRGSWAGAMGHTQFIPTSYLSYAVDFTGDGRRDIWGTDPSDALASTANYLAAFGWERGAPAVRRVILPAGFDYALADGSVRRPVAEWTAMGVAPAEGGALPAADAAFVLLPAGARGPAWLAYPNFRTILRYNNATSYGLAVSLLAEEIAGRRGASRGIDWPRSERPLSRSETVALQQGLTGLGFDTQGTDGIVGPNTRAAVRAFQRVSGLTPDGHVTAELLRAVQAAGG
ncbi:MAG: lytic murein transglycosylase [Rubrimonas sp.]